MNQYKVEIRTARADSTFVNIIDLETPVKNGLDKMNLVLKISDILNDTQGQFYYNWPVDESCDDTIFEQYSNYLTQEEIDQFNKEFLCENEWVRNIREITLTPCFEMKILFPR